MYLDKVRVPQLLSAFWCPPEAAQNGQIYFHDIGDYISQTQKLEQISELASLQPLIAISQFKIAGYKFFITTDTALNTAAVSV